MNKKNKIQLIVIYTLTILLILFLVYQIGYTIHEYISRSKKSEQIVLEFTELYEKDDTQLILFASPACVWCKQFVPVLDEIVKENGLSYYYLDVTSVFENDLDGILEKLKIDFSGIPYLIVLENKEVIGEQGGAQSKEDTIEFLKKIKVIEGDVENGESISTNS